MSIIFEGGRTAILLKPSTKRGLCRCAAEYQILLTTKGAMYRSGNDHAMGMPSLSPGVGQSQLLTEDG